ncbi:hypothetical protein H6G41_21550 [Tolypothrix sp. FACHB-123]|uniref:hypothetical protein n=1 Tax=Tolypothrix sp. FACHB-123 TaxID=2692868 RepID=UPI0019C5281F|nr:hypothetical protein [Tolypothrix sp. FACHB-123]MBD2357176.1 hypothetical protein [Tolypothrix sp. FACHB-123]
MHFYAQLLLLMVNGQLSVVNGHWGASRVGGFPDLSELASLVICPPYHPIPSP